MEFEEWLPPEPAGLDVPLQELNLIVAAITNAGSLYLVVVLASWWFRLRFTRTHLRSFVAGVWLAKLAIWFWSATGIFQIVVNDMTQPLLTLPSRICMMIAVCVMVWVTTKYYQHIGTGRPLFNGERE